MLALKFLRPLTQPFGCNVDFSAQIMDVVYDFCFSGCNCFPALLIPCKRLLRGFITGEFYKLLCSILNFFLQKREIFLIGTVGFTRGNALDKIQLLRIKKRHIRVKLTGFDPLTQCLKIFFGVPDFLFTLLFPFSQFMLSLFCLFCIGQKRVLVGIHAFSFRVLSIQRLLQTVHLFLKSFIVRSLLCILRILQQRGIFRVRNRDFLIKFFEKRLNCFCCDSFGNRNVKCLAGCCDVALNGLTYFCFDCFNRFF